MNNNSHKNKNGYYLSWFLWWKIDQNELEKQVREYKSLRMYESYRGIATLIIISWLVLTDLFSLIHWVPTNQFMVSLFIYQTIELPALLLYSFLALFIYKGKRWAMLTMMFLATIDRGFALFHSISLGTVNTIFWIMIVFWWCVFMKYFYGAYNVEKWMNKSTLPNKSVFRRASISTVLISIASVVVIAYFGMLIFDRLKPKVSPAQVAKKDIIKTLPKVDKKLTTNELVEKNSKYIVFVYCGAKDGDVFASGVVIGRDKNNNLIILTNYHVIENLKTTSSGVPSCGVRVEGEESTKENEYYYVQPTFYPEEISKKDMELIDFALLTVRTEPRIKITRIEKDGTKIETDLPNTFLSLNTFPTICSSEQLKIGEDLVILGFPGVSGVDIPGVESTAKFTATEGIISEKINFSGYYFNTSAKIEYGSSGGGAFLKNSGCLAGLPTLVRAGELESLGRILNANKLQGEFLYKVIPTQSRILK